MSYITQSPYEEVQKENKALKRMLNAQAGLIAEWNEYRSAYTAEKRSSMELSIDESYLKNEIMKLEHLLKLERKRVEDFDFCGFVKRVQMRDDGGLRSMQCTFIKEQDHPTHEVFIREIRDRK